MPVTETHTGPVQVGTAWHGACREDQRESCSRGDRPLQAIEIRNAILIVDHDLAIDEGGAAGEAREGSKQALASAAPIKLLRVKARRRPRSIATRARKSSYGLPRLQHFLGVDSNSVPALNSATRHCRPLSPYEAAIRWVQ